MRRPVSIKLASPADAHRRALHLLAALNLTVLLMFWGSTRALAPSGSRGGRGSGAVVLSGSRRLSAGAAAVPSTALLTTSPDAAVATAGLTAEGRGPFLSSLPPRPPLAGPLDIDAAVADRVALLKASGVGGAPGAAHGRRGYFLSYVETDPLYPFQRIRFADGTDTGVVAIAAPFYDWNYFRR